MTKAIARLRAIPQPDQRTPEWYRFRHELVTASNAYKAFHTEASRNQLICEKCEPINVDKFAVVNVDSPMHWGQKYEEVSSMYYQKTYSTKTEDFGCIRDPAYPFMGASPDGINVDESSPRYGRMLEIKNPTSRVITGRPSRAYWVQMQIQMGVCGLDECDFLETSFKEYGDYSEFQADGTFTETADGHPKGVILFFSAAGKPEYEYAPLGIAEEEFGAWEEEMMQKHQSDTWVKHCYWRLEVASCILVPFNQVWFEYAVPVLRDLWATVELERKSGHEHRYPKKSKKSRKSPELDEHAHSGCMIDPSKMGEGVQLECAM
jgi:putative phage-type endonuclease